MKHISKHEYNAVHYNNIVQYKAAGKPLHDWRVFLHKDLHSFAQKFQQHPLTYSPEHSTKDARKSRKSVV